VKRSNVTGLPVANSAAGGLRVSFVAPAEAGSRQDLLSSAEANCHAPQGQSDSLQHSRRANPLRGESAREMLCLVRMAKTMRSGKHRLGQLKSLAKLSQVKTTLGELIAAAFDTVGNEFYVAQVLSSRELSRAAHARFVLQ
jgi:hypothetical protein